MNKRMLFFVVLLPLFTLFSSCDSEVVISESIILESEIWSATDVVEFDGEIYDVNKFYNFYININIDEEFLTNNLWLFVHTQSPSGNTQSDTVAYFVADERGRWLGKKDGKTIKNKFLYKSNIKFQEAGTYKFFIQHGMRENDLPKVSKIGIRIEEFNSKEHQSSEN